MTDKESLKLLADKDNRVNKLGFTFRRLMVMPVILGYYCAAGMNLYIVPEYVHSKTDKEYNGPDISNYTYDACHSNSTDPGYERYKYVQQETAKWQNYFSLARNIPAIFANLIWASYSDVIGRKALFISCTSGFFVKMLVNTIVIYFNTHVAYILIGEFVDGILGSFTIFLAVLFAYVADVTEPGSKRTTAIVLFELMLGAIISVSTVTVGYYIKYCHYIYPAVTCLGLSFLAVCSAITLVPETLTAKTTGGCRRLVSSIAAAFKLYFKPESRVKQIKYCLLISAFIVYTIQVLNRGNVETLYQLGKPFCWSSTKIGWFGAIRMLFVSLVGMGGIFVLKRFLADDTIAVVSSALTVVSYVVEGLAKTEAVLYAVPVLTTMSVLPVPMIRSLMSRLTPAEKQGAVFATIGAFETACSLIGALTGNLVYSATLSIMNGFVFLILAAITAIGGVILAVFMYVQRSTVDDDVIDDKGAKDIQVKIHSESEWI